VIVLSALDAVGWMAEAPRPLPEDAMQRFKHLCVCAPSYDLSAANAALFMIQAIAQERAHNADSAKPLSG